MYGTAAEGCDSRARTTNFVSRSRPYASQHGLALNNIYRILVKPELNFWQCREQLTKFVGRARLSRASATVPYIFIGWLLSRPRNSTFRSKSKWEWCRSELWYFIESTCWTSTNILKPKSAQSAQPFSSFNQTNEQQFIFIYIDYQLINSKDWMLIISVFFNQLYKK